MQQNTKMFSPFKISRYATVYCCVKFRFLFIFKIKNNKCLWQYTTQLHRTEIQLGYMKQQEIACCLLCHPATTVTLMPKQIPMCSP